MENIENKYYYNEYYNLLDQSGITEMSNQALGSFLENYQKTIVVGLKGIETFKKGRIPDPSVGENACQIRATMLSEFINSEDFLSTVEKTQATFEGILAKIDEVKRHVKERSGKKTRKKGEPSETPVKPTLEAFLKEEGIEASIDQRVSLWIAAYFLTLCRESEVGFAKIDGRVKLWENIKDIPGLKNEGFGRNHVATIEKAAKKYLSEASVTYLQHKAQEIAPEEEGKRLFGMVSGKHVKKTKLSLSTAPCFSGAEILLASAIQQKTPLVVRVAKLNPETAMKEGEEIFFFKSDGSTYQLSVPEEIADKKAAIFCDAVSVADPILSREELEKEFTGKGIKEIILAFMATHPSYGGDLKTLPPPPEESDRLKAYAEKAHEWGICPDNQRVCCLFHMYSSSLHKMEVNHENFDA